MRIGKWSVGLVGNGVLLLNTIDHLLLANYLLLLCRLRLTVSTVDFYQKLAHKFFVGDSVEDC